MAAGTITLKQHGGTAAKEMVGADLGYWAVDCKAAVTAKTGIDASGDLSTVPAIAHAFMHYMTIAVVTVPADDTSHVHVISQGPINVSAADLQVAIRALGTVDSINLSSADVFYRADFRGYHA